MAKVARRLGHASPAVTVSIYAHAMWDDRSLAEREAEALGLTRSGI